jgi:uncharacterized protein with PQ loop repeat
MLSRITRRSRFLYSRSSRLSWIVSDDEKMKENRLITTSSAAALKTMALSPSVSGFALTFLKVSPVITCQALWAAPYPTIKEVVKKKSTGGLPPLPYYSMMANGFLWVVYGCVCDFNPTIIVPNFTGLICGTYYTMQYAKNTSGQFNLMPYTVGAASLMGTVAGIGMFMEQAVAQNAIGLIGCGVVVAMLGGPLQVFKEVVRTKSTKDLPLPMAIATVFNSVCWFGFGSLVVHDAYVWAPNIIGVASGITQLALIGKYGVYREEEVKDEGKKKDN